jgi:hypothetical protein
MFVSLLRYRGILICDNRLKFIKIYIKYYCLVENAAELHFLHRWAIAFYDTQKQVARNVMCLSLALNTALNPEAKRSSYIQFI